MFWLPAILAGASAIGGLLGNRAKKSRQYQSSSSQTDSSYLNSTNMFGTGSTRVDYDPLLYAYRNKMLDTAMNLFEPGRYGDPREVAQSILQQNVSGINQKAALKEKILANEMARRGLSYSPMASYANRVSQSERIAELIQNSNLLPMLERQIRLENEQAENARQALGAQIFSSVPKDTSYETWQGGDTWGSTETKSTGESIGESVTPGNMLGGLFGSLGSLLAFLWGQGAFNNFNSGNWLPPVFAPRAGIVLPPTKKP